VPSTELPSAAAGYLWLTFRPPAGNPGSGITLTAGSASPSYANPLDRQSDTQSVQSDTDRLTVTQSVALTSHYPFVVALLTIVLARLSSPV